MDGIAEIVEGVGGGVSPRVRYNPLVFRGGFIGDPRGGAVGKGDALDHVLVSLSRFTSVAEWGFRHKAEQTECTSNAPPVRSGAVRRFRFVRPFIPAPTDALTGALQALPFVVTP